MIEWLFVQRSHSVRPPAICCLSQILVLLILFLALSPRGGQAACQENEKNEGQAQNEKVNAGQAPKESTGQAPKESTGQARPGDEEADTGQARWASELWEAARKGDAEVIRRLVGEGADVNVKTDYGATALMFATSRGHRETVELLLSEGADPNIRDKFYSATPMAWAAMKKQVNIAVLLAESGSKDLSTALSLAVRENDPTAAQRILTLNVSEAAKQAAKRALPATASDQLKELFADVETPAAPQPKSSDADWEPTSEQLAEYAGEYESSTGPDVSIRVVGGRLQLDADGNVTTLAPGKEHRFEFGSTSIEFRESDRKIQGLTITSGRSVSIYNRRAGDLPEFGPSRQESLDADRQISSVNWMQFRGPGARGVAEGQHPPIKWDVPGNQNVMWKREVQGLANSCPIVVGDLVFVTTAIGEKNEAGLRTGLYGDVDSVEDDSELSFELHCLDKNSGATIWTRIAHTGKAQVKRHLKSTHANPTPASDGKYVVAFFGSEGLYCFDLDGNLQWQRQFGLLDSGWFFDASYQWGFAASPVIYGDAVIVQCDIQEGSFVASLNLETGKENWRTARNEIPSWSTPTIVSTSSGPQLITNATKYVRAYNPDSGEELWRIGNNSEIVVPTPFSAHDLIFVASGYRPVQPIYAVRPSARGDITLATGQRESEAVAWSINRGGPYMPSPLCYGDYLYICSNSGILTCYEATTGKRVYRKRISSSDVKSFVAAPLAADGHLYFPSESGTTVVVKAGPEFEKIAENALGESMLATPAISDGVIFLRGQRHLVAVSESE